MCSDSAVIVRWIVRWTYGITVQKVDVAQCVDELAVLYTATHGRNTTTVRCIVSFRARSRPGRSAVPEFRLIPQGSLSPFSGRADEALKRHCIGAPLRC